MAFTLAFIYFDHRMERRVQSEMEKLVQVKKTFDSLKLEAEDLSLR